MYLKIVESFNPNFVYNALQLILDLSVFAHRITAETQTTPALIVDSDLELTVPEFNNSIGEINTLYYDSIKLSMNNVPNASVIRVYKDDELFYEQKVFKGEDLIYDGPIPPGEYKAIAYSSIAGYN